MNQTLENKISNANHANLKSEGERRIANFLEANSIKYQYEPALLINSDQKPRIWYPDFYLPEFAAYIEYYGLAGKQNYDDGVKRKETQYSKAGLAVIPIYPWTFSENWEGYILNELERVTIDRYRNLMAKPYWAARQNNNPNHARYRQGSTSHY
jgi:hypothetical protein